MLRKDIHRQYLYNIIMDIFRSPFAKYLAFKGGTACYFIHELSRFSTDIDIDVIESLPDGMNIDDEIIGLLNKYGKVKQGHQIILSYGESDANIHIDISRKIWKSNAYEVKSFFGQDIMVQDKGTIVANKLVALCERGANRDFFDVWFFLSHTFPIYENLIIERTGGGLISLYKKIIGIIDNLPKGYKILDGLGETLYDEKQKARVKKYLLQDIKGILQLRLMK